MISSALAIVLALDNQPTTSSDANTTKRESRRVCKHRPQMALEASIRQVALAAPTTELWFFTFVPRPRLTSL